MFDVVSRWANPNALSLDRRTEFNVKFAPMKQLVKICAIAMVATALGAPLAMAAPGDTTTATVYSTSDPSLALGKVHFTEGDGTMKVEADFEGISPSFHGFHIHTEGSCADGGKAAGGHFNPDGNEHGSLAVNGISGAHAGDLGNVFADSQGSARFVQTVPGLTISEGTYAIQGRSVILHEKPDDFGQPTGNAGGRIGCGVISD